MKEWVKEGERYQRINSGSVYEVIAIRRDGNRVKVRNVANGEEFFTSTFRLLNHFNQIS